VLLRYLRLPMVTPVLEQLLAVALGAHHHLKER
jgi:hypothetical protein